MTNRPIVFPHLPKCGGTSLLEHLKSSGLRLHLDYESWSGPQAAVRNRELENTDFSAYDIIYGHFPIERYEGPDYRYVALVRDPIERAISNYAFHREMALANPSGKDMYTRIGRWIDQGELSFIEYLNVAPGMKTIYERLMGYWSRRRFTLIGTTAKYGAFLEALSDLTGCKFENTIQERRRKEGSIDLSEADMKRARQLLFAEYKWYDAFVAKAV